MLNPMELALIKKLGGGNGGGGGGGADLLNADGIIKQEVLPEGYPYPGEPTIEYIVPEHVPERNNDTNYNITVEPKPLANGTTYTVAFNGQEYKQKTTFVPEINTYYLGNMSLVGGEDTGEPFCIVVKPGGVEGETGVFGYVLTVAGTVANSVAVYKTVDSNTPIAQKFLPEGYPYVSEGYVFPESQLEIAFDGSAYGCVLLNFPALTIGENYIVNWNGTSYSCVAQALNIGGIVAAALGNAVIMGGDDSGEPFAFIRFHDEAIASMGAACIVAELYATEDHTVTVSIVGKTITHIAQKFLPKDLNKLKVVCEGKNSTPFEITSADHSYNEILAAITDGAEVSLVVNYPEYDMTTYEIYRFCGINQYEIQFAYHSHMGGKYIYFNQDGTIEAVEG